MASDFAYLLVVPFEPNSDIMFSFIPVLYCNMFAGTIGI